MKHDDYSLSHSLPVIRRSLESAGGDAVSHRLAEWKGAAARHRNACRSEACRLVIKTGSSRAARGLGYTVSKGAITDAVSGITITQSCVNNPDLYEPLPIRPVSVGPGVSLQAPGAACPPPHERMVLVTAGQSNASMTGQSRYSASDHVFVYHNGQCFRAYDPLIGADGDDGSPWGRLADMLVSSGRYENVVIIALARSSSTIEEWAPGGNLNEHLLTHLKDAVSSGMLPTHFAWHQGEGNARWLSTWEQYRALYSRYKNNFMSLVASIRSIGITAAIYPAVATICNIRSGRWPPREIAENSWIGPGMLIFARNGAARRFVKPSGMWRLATGSNMDPTLTRYLRGAVSMAAISRREDFGITQGSGSKALTSQE